jgi:hypothetical protein
MTGDYDFMYLHPTGIADLDIWATAHGHPDLFDPGEVQEPADNNGNGVKDADEFKLLEAIFADAANPLHATLHEAYKANVAQLLTDLGSLSESLGPTLKNVMAAYVLLGDGGFSRYNYEGTDYGYGFAGSWGVVGAAIASMDSYGSLWTETAAPSVALYGRYPDLVSMCGDADGDGVANINEYYAAANVAAYVLAALDDAATATAADPNNVCAAPPTGYAFGENVFYNPANQHVYVILAHSIWPVCRQIAETFQIGETPVAGTLVRIDDAAENTWVATTIITATLDDKIWAGATDQATEGKWLWIDNNDQFWQGTAAGSVQNGLYSHWGAPVGSGEPNNSSNEDWLEIDSGGGWNDNKIGQENYGLAEFTNGGAGYPDTTPADGIPDFWATLLSMTTVTISDAPTGAIITGSTVVLTASSDSEEDTSFAWESSNEDVATVASASDTTAEVTAVSKGSAIITATADVSGATRSVTVYVREPEWFEMCSVDDLFSAQGMAFALLLNALDDEMFPDDDWSTYNLDNMFCGYGLCDEIPDAWQLSLLAWDLCKNEEFQTKVDSANVAAQFVSNLAKMQGFLEALKDTPAYIQTLGATHMVASGTAIATIAATAGGTEKTYLTNVTITLLQMLGYSPTDAANMANYVIIGAAIPVPSNPMYVNGLTLAGYGPALADAMGAESDLALVAPMLYDDKELLTGLLGLSTEMNTTVQAILEAAGLLGSGGLLESLDEYLGAAGTGVIPVLMVYSAVLDYAAGHYAAQCPVTVANQPTVHSAYVFAAAIPASWNAAPPFIEFPELEIYGTGGKLGDEPYSGAGDYDGDGKTNNEVFNAVNGAGGDVQDFINGATGAAGPFWPGNPDLPVAGMLGLAILSGALVVAYTRRSKR